MGLVSAMARFKKVIINLVFLLTFCLLVIVIAIVAVLARKPLLSLFAKAYLQSQGLTATFHLRELTWTHFAIDDIVIQKTQDISLGKINSAIASLNKTFLLLEKILKPRLKHGDARLQP